MVNQNQGEDNAASTICGTDFLVSIDTIHQQYRNNAITASEYKEIKLKLIKELSSRIIRETPEQFLGATIPLMDKKILSINDIHEIKTIVFRLNKFMIR